MSDATSNDFSRGSLWSLTQQAWGDMIRMLFKPFRWAVWWRLALVALFAGALSGGGLDWPSNSSSNDAPSSGQVVAEEFEEIAVALESEGGIEAEEQAEADGGNQTIPETAEFETAGEDETWNYYDFLDIRDRIYFFARDKVVWISAILGGFFLLGVIWTWINSRCLFLFVDLLMRRRIGLMKGFRRVREDGDELFVFQVVLGIVGLILFIAGGWFAYRRIDWVYGSQPGVPAGEFFMENFFTLLAPVFALLVFWGIAGLLSLIFYVWLIDFIVPIRYHDRSSLLQAIGRWFSFVGSHPLEALKYLLWRLLMSIVVGAGTAALGVVVFLSVLFAGGLIGALGMLLAFLMPFLKTVFVVLGIIFGVLTAVVLMVLMALAMLPGAVLMRYFSLRYLDGLSIGYRYFGKSKVRRA